MQQIYCDDLSYSATGVRWHWLPPEAAPQQAVPIRGYRLQQLIAVMQPRGWREGRSDDAGRGGAGWVLAGRGEAWSHALAHPNTSHALRHRSPGKLQ